MMKKYLPGAVSFALFQFVPIMMRHTRFKEYTTAYTGILFGLEVLLLAAVLIVRRNRRKMPPVARL